MADPLGTLRSLSHSPSSAVRWACLLEAMSPKAGNVFPGREFEDLAYKDFVAAAEITARHLDSVDRISARMYQAVHETITLTKTNVNLGIVLLIGPLVAADERMLADSVDQRTDEAWKLAVKRVLESLDGVDGQNIFRSIQIASAGGLGEVDSMDVNATSGEVDIVEAMRLAEERDRIALQYAGGFKDLIENVVPVVGDSIVECGDTLTGIQLAHLRLLQLQPDSLIARKNGLEVARSVQSAAQQVDPKNAESLAKFDDSLRSSAHKLNPGTTADLVAAALYLLLRSREQFSDDS